MSIRRDPGDTVTIQKGRLRGTADCPVRGNLAGAKALIIRGPKRGKNPVTGQKEDRIVVKPILESGALAFPVEISARDVRRSDPVLADVGTALANQHQACAQSADMMMRSMGGGGGGGVATAPAPRTRSRAVAGIGPGTMNPRRGGHFRMAGGRTVRLK